MISSSFVYAFSAVKQTAKRAPSAVRCWAYLHLDINRLTSSGNGNVNAAPDHHAVREAALQAAPRDLPSLPFQPTARTRRRQQQLGPRDGGGGLHAAPLQLHAAPAHLAQQVRPRHAALPLRHGECVVGQSVIMGWAGQ